MLETTLEGPGAEDEVAVAQAENQGQADEVVEEELADEVVVEISVDGMCGVY